MLLLAPPLMPRPASTACHQGVAQCLPRHFMRLIGVAIVFLLPQLNRPTLQAEFDGPPNIIFVMADDLGYGDLGCFGQQVIQTPRLDQMARQGMRLTQFYAGNTVCAPSRCVLMTGRHMGHAHVRGNANDDMSVQTLRDEDVTVAEVLKQAGYTNALIGKWGLGEVDSIGFPLRQGFDRFFGYLNQVHAHNYYPEFLWDGDQRRPLRNVVQRNDRSYGGFTGGFATKRIDYSHDIFVNEAMAFVREHESVPFFLYLPLTIPHANNEGSRMTKNGAEVPDFGPYAKEDWPDPDKGQAAMITRMDGDVGRLLDLLTELKIDRRTLVIFTSDNGPHNESNHNLARFQPSGPLRGTKRALYEGGIRVPTIAWWPGVIEAGSESNHIAYFGDLMATVAELANVEPPEGLDSVSFVPTLMGKPAEQQTHDYLYWEFYEQGGRQAVRFGDWKAIRQPGFDGPIELYNLASDLSEQKNLADRYPDKVQQAAKMMEEAHVDHPAWQVRKR